MQDHVIYKKDSFTSSFPNRMPFIYFSCLIFLSRTPSTMLNRTGESRQPNLVPDLMGKVSSLLPVILMLAMGFSRSLLSG